MFAYCASGSSRAQQRAQWPRGNLASAAATPSARCAGRCPWAGMPLAMAIRLFCYRQSIVVVIGMAYALPSDVQSDLRAQAALRICDGIIC